MLNMRETCGNCTSDMKSDKRKETFYAGEASQRFPSLLQQGRVERGCVVRFCDFKESVRCGTSRLWQDNAISKIELQTAVFHLLHQ